VDQYERTAEISYKSPQQKGGMAGALGKILLRFPELETELVQLIRQDAKYRKIFAHQLRPKDLHHIFIQCLKNKISSGALNANSWPFTTRYLGLKTIQKFMSWVLLNNFSRSVNKRGEQEARAHLNVGTGYETFLTFEEPFDAVEIDAYNIEAHMTVQFLTPEGLEQDLLLERIWYVAAVDRVSTAILAHRMVYRSEVTSDDVAHVIRDAITKKWEPLSLSLPTLKYPENGGLPSGVIEQAFGAVWSMTMLDGALAHLAKKIRERARVLTGFVLNWGPPGHFERRPNVERTFKQIAEDVIRQLPSSTGSHPHKGRVPDGEKKAVQYKIRSEDIEEILDVNAALHNATPHKGISYFSPLEILRAFLEGDEPRSFARKLPEAEFNSVKKFSCIEQKTVRGDLKNGRRPYIQLDGVQYTSPILAEAGTFIGKKLIIEIDEDDYRQVQAFTLDGSDLGFLKAKGRWGVTRHSRRTRKAINSLITKRILVLTEFDNPIQRYLEHLSTPTKKNKNKELTLSPRQVTDATRISKESDLPRQIHHPKVRTSKLRNLSDYEHVNSPFTAPKPTQGIAKNRR